MITARFLDADCDLLVRLLQTPTAGPLETGPGAPPPQLWRAQRAYATTAAELGLRPVHHGAPAPEEVYRDDVPVVVRRAVTEIPGFLANQPSLVLRLGPPLPRAATVMFNVHLDTVSGLEQVGFDGVRFHGRGAIDAKGPAVALLAGIRAARAAEPAVGAKTGVLIQAVSGEEGGVMGTIGTRPLVQRGFVGRLNFFCEPTGLRYLPRATAAMTARVRVDGRDAIDDRPECGHNATVLLGFLAQHLGLALSSHASEGRVCVAGVRTGPLHNRVYGTGELLINLSYSSPETGRRLESSFEAALHEGLTDFTRRFRSTREFALTAEEATSVTRLEWLKRRLPALAGADPWAERLLEGGAGLARWPDDEPAFTCDAIWMHGVPGAFTVVFGPGDLAVNNAHALGEFADLAELEAFASGIARMLVSFSHSEEHHREDNRNGS
jgi:acetylornithine deacetylase/succinyl-diaminopimelate desuccinylase-like protein